MDAVNTGNEFGGAQVTLGAGYRVHGGLETMLANLIKSDDNAADHFLRAGFTVFGGDLVAVDVATGEIVAGSDAARVMQNNVAMLTAWVEVAQGTAAEFALGPDASPGQREQAAAAQRERVYQAQFAAFRSGAGRIPASHLNNPAWDVGMLSFAAHNIHAGHHGWTDFPAPAWPRLLQKVLTRLDRRVVRYGAILFSGQTVKTRVITAAGGAAGQAGQLMRTIVADDPEIPMSPQEMELQQDIEVLRRQLLEGTARSEHIDTLEEEVTQLTSWLHDAEEQDAERLRERYNALRMELHELHVLDEVFMAQAPWLQDQLAEFEALAMELAEAAEAEARAGRPDFEPGGVYIHDRGESYWLVRDLNAGQL